MDGQPIRAAAPPAGAAPASPYAAPTLRCDVVMKGGITSGVVYPLAVCELARDYEFKSIGGTSAGAIAAAATAAAEYGRLHGTGTSFAELEGLPRWLGDPSPSGLGSNLFMLFQPQRATRPLFDIAVSTLQKEGRARRVLEALVTAFPGAALLGALPGLAVAIAAFALADGAGRWIFLLAALLLLAIGLLAGVAFATVRTAVRELPRNGFGMCAGRRDGTTADALTPWLADLLDRVAGKPKPAEPLTFGDLWGANPDVEHEIDLQFVTTNLTHGRPHNLPFETGTLYFREEEMSGLFPERVVRWMMDHPQPPNPNDKREAALLDRLRAQGYIRLPAPADLPVIVAARLSLSFPFLIRAIPFHAIDFTRSVDEDEKRVPEPVWFSDGGLCSNFPVHFFDRPLPAWPTFGINLRDVHPDHPIDPADQCANSYTPRDNRGGIEEWWNRFDRAEGGFAKLGGFVGSLLFTAKDWHDNVQLRVPGYRDRVAHVSLSAVEGGLNLDMPPEFIVNLGERGRCAAEKIGDRFARDVPGTKLTWDNHRWVRFRSTMALLEGELRAAREVFFGPAQGGPPYPELVARPRGAAPSYQWDSAAQRDACLAWVDRLLGDPFLAQTADTFTGGAPRPLPEMRIVPRL